MLLKNSNDTALTFVSTSGEQIVSPPGLTWVTDDLADSVEAFLGLAVGLETYTTSQIKSMSVKAFQAFLAIGLTEDCKNHLLATDGLKAGHSAILEALVRW